MFKKILVAYDGSDGAKLALAKAVEIAKASQTEMHVLAVGRIPEYAETVSEVAEEKDQAQRYYTKILDDASTRLKQQGLSAAIRLEFGKPADVILRIAEELTVELIVMGTNPHSPITRRFLGATVDKVIDHAHCSVLVVRA
ncbi:MAG: universal stress protein [Candidatus Binatia bacterium]